MARLAQLCRVVVEGQDDKVCEAFGLHTACAAQFWPAVVLPPEVCCCTECSLAFRQELFHPWLVFCSQAASEWQTAPCRSRQGADGTCPLPSPPRGHPFGLCWRPRAPCCRDARFSFTLWYFGHSLRAGKRHFTLQTGLQGITCCFQDWRVPYDGRVLCPLTALSHVSASDSLPRVQTQFYLQDQLMDNKRRILVVLSNTLP